MGASSGCCRIHRCGEIPRVGNNGLHTKLSKKQGKDREEKIEGQRTRGHFKVKHT